MPTNILYPPKPNFWLCPRIYTACCVVSSIEHVKFKRRCDTTCVRKVEAVESGLVPADNLSPALHAPPSRRRRHLSSERDGAVIWPPMSICDVLQVTPPFPGPFALRRPRNGCIQGRDASTTCTKSCLCSSNPRCRGLRCKTVL